MVGMESENITELAKALVERSQLEAERVNDRIVGIAGMEIKPTNPSMEKALKTASIGWFEDALRHPDKFTSARFFKQCFELC
ncbi:hypothetical protein A3F00_04350 [Candidatus Daviesbacteria bacterium RIFCSPHIGHO2_12_FULL_37_11]|uniref:Uncharacterized protein n=1 Tax=Candidatus Daviesbacteria bacterium RIFCSPHIGHO2_12_FULL_37_11 TaxID=1797777 RepID=A0A1F5K9S6_9BACT|nr:MAG: hypothetical protein A2111_01935 [Candidatus Daviesbacteria bacterium GWA1_38_6]OGE16132.1 MAG: hypothetical protein A2769_03520 [Candidatus Daviesbacteria bacterium RIFCSPHIGHO2_01_FULL_37_27]OGE37656.1 MAG: hypothetical protein A3F00_04350 [Candidatus Daviesbacteria bacterium RIFCSPHIGHO2_12_FULL_37_11]OGE45412.1 MAG: hypothetical protein A3B39_04750 [Candidatus Daviesbacteria bacterium RIFCSPLOWO2_01_FULL_37_10]